MKTKHLILVRYSVSLFKRYGEDFAMKWLAHRLLLFRRTLVPSLSNQTCKDFTPVFFCDTKTPTAYTDKLREIVTPFGGHVVDHTFLFYNRQGLFDYLNITPGNTDLIISTRLDNDDVVDKDFVARVQSEAIHHWNIRQSAFALDFSTGYWLFCGPEYRLFKMHINYPTQFLSVVEPVHPTDPCCGTKGPYCVNHPKMGDEFPVVTNASFPAWLWMVYGGMQTTFLLSGKTVTPEKAAYRGGIELPTDDVEQALRKRFDFGWPPVLDNGDEDCKTTHSG